MLLEDLRFCLLDVSGRLLLTLKADYFWETYPLGISTALLFVLFLLCTNFIISVEDRGPYKVRKILRRFSGHIYFFFFALFCKHQIELTLY